MLKKQNSLRWMMSVYRKHFLRMLRTCVMYVTHMRSVRNERYAYVDQSLLSFKNP